MQSTLTIKVSEEKKARIQRLARERQVSVSALVKEALDRALGEDRSSAASCYDLARKYFETEGAIGSSGMSDLASNKEHLMGFGRSR